MVTWFTYGTLRQFADRRSSRLLVTPFAIAMGLMRLNDYVGYNGEQLPVLLHAASALVIVRAQVGKQTSHFEWMLTGAALGAIPYTKLQAAPIGVVLGCWALVLLWRDRRAVTLVSSVFVVNSAIWGTMWMSGQVEDYWTRCIAQSLEYSQEWSPMPLLNRFYAFPIVWLRIAEARWFIAGCFGVIAISSAEMAWMGWDAIRAGNKLLLGPVCYVMVSAYCVSQSGNFFTHYFFFMLHPMFLCATCFVLHAQILKNTNESASARPATLLSVAFCCLRLGFQVSCRRVRIECSRR
jgi:hypothetical protein